MSETPTPIIPNLGPMSIISSPVDILAYVIRYYTTAPKSVSDATHDLMISLADDVSRYQSDPNNLISVVTTSLQSVYNRYFPGRSITVDVSANDNGNGTYNITIQVSVILDGINYTLGSDVQVNRNGVLLLTFHPTLN